MADACDDSPLSAGSPIMVSLYLIVAFTLFLAMCLSMELIKKRCRRRRTLRQLRMLKQSDETDGTERLSGTERFSQNDETICEDGNGDGESSYRGSFIGSELSQRLNSLARNLKRPEHSTSDQYFMTHPSRSNNALDSESNISEEIRSHNGLSTGNKKRSEHRRKINSTFIEGSDVINTGSKQSNGSDEHMFGNS
jgi:hypothetical protein